MEDGPAPSGGAAIAARQCARGVLAPIVKEFRGGLSSDGRIEWQATIEVAFKVD